MANSIIGKVHIIGPAQSIVSKKDPTRSFYKRLLVIDATRYDGLTGVRGFDNYPSFEFSGDNCALLDNLQVGQIVTVYFDLQGSKYTGQDGKDRWFTSIRGYKIEPRQTQTTPPPTAPQPPAHEIMYQQPATPAQPPQPIATDIDPLPFL